MPDCPTGKKPYPNGAAAAREARKLRRNTKSTSELRPYRCPECSQYHLGNGFGRNGNSGRGNLRQQKRDRYRSFA